MRTIDGIQRTHQRAPEPREDSPPRRSLRRNGGEWLFLFLLTVTGLGFLLIRPSAHGPTATTATSSSEKPDSASSLHLPQGGDLNTPLDKLVILDHPSEFSAPQTDQSTTKAPEEAPSAQPNADFTVRILNGGGVAGAAGKLRDELQGKGFTVSSIGNAQTSHSQTTIYYQSGKRSGAEKVAEAIGQSSAALTGDSIAAPADVLVVIGADRQ